MDVKQLSTRYLVRKLTNSDIQSIYKLSLSNPLYYKFCPPTVTEKSIEEDMQALPPNKTVEDKFYIGFFGETGLVAMMDLILAYPNAHTAFIGLFMIDQEYQGHGIGSFIIEECCSYLKQLGFINIRLGFVKGNPQSEAFWLKCGFNATGDESIQENYTVVISELEIR